MTHLEKLRESIQRGEPINYERIAMLQTLDFLELGNAFVNETIKREEDENERIKKYLDLA